MAKRLGTLLVEEQLITEEQLQEALARQRTSGEQLGEALVNLGFITEEPLYRFLAIQHGLEFSSIGSVEIPDKLLRVVPAAVAWKYRAVPVRQDNGTVIVATSQPDDLSLSYLPRELKLPESTKVKIMVAPASQVGELLKKHFPKASARGGDIKAADRAGGALKAQGEETDPTQRSLLDAVESELLDADDVNLEVLDDKREEEEDEIADEGPVIKMCEYIIANAVKNRASDVHINPYERQIILKYRIDGSCVEFPAPPVNAKRRIATRLKIMAGMNIIEKNRPQSGRIHMKIGGRPVEVRMETLPCRWGENIVMRIVDQTNAVLDLDQLGFEEGQLKEFKRAISQPYGMVFVTGPTASGKTTTLFAALSQINVPTKNILTVEDPVEFRLPHIVQISVDEVAGRTFASVLRAFLRHDPNIVLVGEVRDSETATIAVQASLTGHLVLTSVHTNDAASTIMRLMDLGIEAVYVGSSVLCVASQRLVKRVCEQCKEPVEITQDELLRLNLKPKDIEDGTFFRGRGCSHCHNSGYHGRLAIYEVMPVSQNIQQIIFSKGTLGQLKDAAKDEGFKTLREAAVNKWKRGLTTIEEVLAETFE